LHHANIAVKQSYSTYSNIHSVPELRHFIDKLFTHSLSFGTSSGYITLDLLLHYYLIIILHIYYLNHEWLLFAHALPYSLLLLCLLPFVSMANERCIFNDIMRTVLVDRRSVISINFNSVQTGFSQCARTKNTANLPVLKILQNTVIAFTYVVSDANVWQLLDVESLCGKPGRRRHSIFQVCTEIVHESLRPAIVVAAQQAVKCITVRCHQQIADTIRVVVCIHICAVICAYPMLTENLQKQHKDLGLHRGGDTAQKLRRHAEDETP